MFFIEVKRKMVFFISLIIFLLIKQSLSAVMWTFDEHTLESQTDDYTISRQASKPNNEYLKAFTND